MDKNAALEIARKYNLAIQPYFKVEKSYLFGSYAKNTANKDSDIDIAVFINDNIDFYEAQLKLLKLRRDLDLRIEPHPIFNIHDILYNDIITTGIQI